MYSVGVPSAGAERQLTASPSISSVCCSTSAIASREDSCVRDPAYTPPTRVRARRVRDRLREIYGIPTAQPHGRALDELLLTVLSQSTNDRNRDVAFLRLRERFASADRGHVCWEAVRDAPRSEVEEAIRPGGISKVKSARIQEILRAIGEPLDLAGLADAPVEEARAYLMD